jgi:hypothetical protein
MRPSIGVVRDDRDGDSPLLEDALDLAEEVIDQCLGVLECVGTAGVGLRAMPVVGRDGTRLVSCSSYGNAMGVVDPEPRAVRDDDRKPRADRAALVGAGLARP